MSNVPITAIAEIVSLLLRAAFDLARKGGMTPDQVDKAFTEEYDRFLENDPSTLPDV